MNQAQKKMSLWNTLHMRKSGMIIKTPTKDGTIAIATRNTLGLFIQPQPYSWEFQTVKSGIENSF
mgnify:CR=1 FL=1